MTDALLETAAVTLGPLLEEVVFLGGASIDLWLSDPGAPAVRTTDDVDVVCDITSLAAYYRLGERLRERGFAEASDSRVICRWRHRDTGLVLDVMPRRRRSRFLKPLVCAHDRDGCGPSSAVRT
jgi:hypothetical protein